MHDQERDGGNNFQWLIGGYILYYPTAPLVQRVAYGHDVSPKFRVVQEDSWYVDVKYDTRGTGDFTIGLGFAELYVKMAHEMGYKSAVIIAGTSVEDAKVIPALDVIEHPNSIDYSSSGPCRLVSYTHGIPLDDWLRQA